MTVPFGLSLRQPDHPPPPPLDPPPHLPSGLGALGSPPGGRGGRLLGQRPHLEHIRFMKLVAVSQAPVPLIPQRPVRAVNKDSNLFIKNEPPSPQASRVLLISGREGLGRPRVRATPLPPWPGSGHSASDSPSDSRHAWDSLGTGHQAAPATPPPQLCDRALWPSNRCAQLHLGSSPCANRGPSGGIYCRENTQALSACGRQPHPTPCPRILRSSLEQLRSTNSGALATVYSNLCPSRAGPPRNRGQSLRASTHK